MQSALLNRFQATLLGALIGEMIGVQFCNRSWHEKLRLKKSIFFYAESLIYLDRVEDPDDPIFQEPLTTATGAIALLPVFLFFHEDFPKLRQNVEQVTRLWQSASVSELDLQAVGYTLSQALLETLEPATLVSQLLASTLAPPEGIQRLQRLQQVEALIRQGVGLEDAVQAILTLSDATTGDAAIALALYCFLSTPGDFRLSVLRAARTGYHVSIVAALTGALSGAYNSTVAIPPEWRLKVSQQSEILHLATQLLAQWSGVYHLAPESPLLPVAAPQVIRKLP